LVLGFLQGVRGESSLVTELDPERFPKRIW
jgi:hypothetical protein